MTFFTQEPTGVSRLEDLDAPFGEVLSANMRRAFLTNPMPSAGRAMDLAGASSGYANDLSSGEFGLPVAVDEQQLSQNIPAVDARRRLQEEQLDTHLKIPETGIRKDALDIIIARKKEELALKSVIDRSPGGVVLGAANILTGLAVSLLDPINVASGFIPVIGPERYAALLANAGANAAARAGIRAGVGAAEGVVGSAIVEPIVLGAAMQEQADYGIADSLLNVAFGGVLGGGMHAGIGRYADWRNGVGRQEVARVPEILQGASLETRQALARTAIADFAQGRMPDVEALARLDPHIDRRMSSTSMTRVGSVDDGLGAYLDARMFDEAAARAQAVREARATQAEVDAQAAKLRDQTQRAEPSLFEFLAGAGGLKADPELRIIFDKANPSIAGTGRLIRKGQKGMSLDRAVEAAMEAGYISDPGFSGPGALSKSITDLLELLDREHNGQKQYRAGYVPPENNKVDAGAYLQDRRMMEEIDARFRKEGINPDGINQKIKYDAARMVDRGDADSLAYAVGVVDNVVEPSRQTPDIPFDRPESEIAKQRLSAALDRVREQARQRFNEMTAAMDAKINADVEAKLQAAERQNSMPDEAAKAEMDSAVVDLQEFAKARGLDDLAARELKAADAIIAEGDTYAKAAQAMVNCQLRRA